MIYQGLPVEIVNAGLRLLRLADRSLGQREPFYKFNFQGWKLLILPPSPKLPPPKPSGKKPIIEPAIDDDIPSAIDDDVPF